MSPVATQVFRIQLKDTNLLRATLDVDFYLEATHAVSVECCATECICTEYNIQC